MPVIISNPKNRRNCERCNAGYVINGDESSYWCLLPWPGIKNEGKCQFCKPEYLGKCHSLLTNCDCNLPNVHTDLVCSKYTKEEKMKAYYNKKGINPCK